MNLPSKDVLQVGIHIAHSTDKGLLSPQIPAVYRHLELRWVPPTCWGILSSCSSMHRGFTAGIAAIALSAKPPRWSNSPLAGAFGQCRITAAPPGKATELRYGPSD